MKNLEWLNPAILLTILLSGGMGFLYGFGIDYMVFFSGQKSAFEPVMGPVLAICFMIISALTFWGGHDKKTSGKVKCKKDWFVVDEKANPVPIHKILMETVEVK